MRNTVIAIIIASFVGAGFLFVAVSNKSMGERRFVFNYEKGVYRGPTDPPLSHATIEALRARAGHQAAAEGDLGSSSGPGTNGASVRVGEGAGGR
ncbi:MAG: hypothetical protein KF815_01930 [Rhodospirillales bacterium]|nr:hypothetical protein [Rhodospirillales bacterium]